MDAGIHLKTEKILFWNKPVDKIDKKFIHHVKITIRILRSIVTELVEKNSVIFIITFFFFQNNDWCFINRSGNVGRVYLFFLYDRLSTALQLLLNWKTEAINGV